MTYGRFIRYVLAFLLGGDMVYEGMAALINQLIYGVRFDSVFNTLAVCFIIIGSMLLAYVPSSVAGHKGHSDYKWFVYAFFLWPIALVHSLLVKDYEQDYRVCPFCAEHIKKEAKVCRYCGKDMPVSEDSEKYQLARQ